MRLFINIKNNIYNKIKSSSRKKYSFTNNNFVDDFYDYFFKC